MKLIKELGNKFIELYDNLTNVDSSWENKPYDFYLIFGPNDESKSPWISKNWKTDFEPYFDLLLKQTENLKDTGIRGLKYKPEKRISKKDNKEFIYNEVVKLGRLKWDEKSHDKWTIVNNTDNYFVNFELWNPIWTICDKKQTPPDIYIKISNERDFENKRNVQFGYFIVVSIAKNLNINSKQILIDLSEKINSKVTILKTRKWGKTEKVGNWTFVNSIQDTFSNGIYKGENIHNIEFDKLDFEPVWEIIWRKQ